MKPTAIKEALEKKIKRDVAIMKKEGAPQFIIADHVRDLIMESKFN